LPGNNFRARAQKLLVQNSFSVGGGATGDSTTALSQTTKGTKFTKEQEQEFAACSTSMTANKPPNRGRRTISKKSDARLPDFLAFLVFFVPLWFMNIAL
jgi:hypothetical protein